MASRTPAATVAISQIQSNLAGLPCANLNDANAILETKPEPENGSYETVSEQLQIATRKDVIANLVTGALLKRDVVRTIIPSPKMAEDESASKVGFTTPAKNGTVVAPAVLNELSRQNAIANQNVERLNARKVLIDQAGNGADFDVPMRSQLKHNVCDKMDSNNNIKTNYPKPLPCMTNNRSKVKALKLPRGRSPRNQTYHTDPVTNFANIGVRKIATDETNEKLTLSDKSADQFMRQIVPIAHTDRIANRTLSSASIQIMAQQPTLPQAALAPNDVASPKIAQHVETLASPHDTTKPQQSSPRSLAQVEFSTNPPPWDLIARHQIVHQQFRHLIWQDRFLCILRLTSHNAVQKLQRGMRTRLKIRNLILLQVLGNMSLWRRKACRLPHSIKVFPMMA